jgi:uncharacterized protein YjbI with pentapeptide repeats
MPSDERRGCEPALALWDHMGIRNRGHRRVANDEHVAILRQGTATWNEWRRHNQEIKPDLSGAKLRGMDLSSANLSRAELSKAELNEANLNDANLSEANLSGADLSYSSFVRTDFSDVNLSDAILASADLAGADLRGANLLRANLGEADLTRANLASALLGGAVLAGADLRASWLVGAVLTETYLYGANLSGADVSGADLSRAELRETILGNVDLGRTLGLNDCHHSGPSIIDFRTLSRSGSLPISFLRGCGLPDHLIDYLPSLRNDPIQFYSCFISYSAKDQVFADRLHADLQNKGVRCWFAPHDLPWGAKTWDAIDEAIRLRDKLLLILSKASIASEWVEDEVNKAYAEERSRKEVVLFPVRIDNAVMSTDEPWAVKLRDQRNIGDFRQWKKPDAYQKSLDRLLRDLKTAGTK